MRWSVPALALAGMTACAPIPASVEAGLCIGLGPHVSALERALLAHPETPQPVGEAGTDVVIGYDAGCRDGFPPL